MTAHGGSHVALEHMCRIFHSPTARMSGSSLSLLAPPADSPPGVLLCSQCGTALCLAEPAPLEVPPCRVCGWWAAAHALVLAYPKQLPHHLSPVPRQADPYLQQAYAVEDNSGALPALSRRFTHACSARQRCGVCVPSLCSRLDSLRLLGLPRRVWPVRLDSTSRTLSNRVSCNTLSISGGFTTYDEGFESSLSSCSCTLFWACAYAF